MIRRQAAVGRVVPLTSFQNINAEGGRAFGGETAEKGVHSASLGASPLIALRVGQKIMFENGFCDIEECFTTAEFFDQTSFVSSEIGYIRS